MCDTGNLIDLTGWDEPAKDETVTEDPVVVESQHFKGPYDPFDSMEKEACIKGLHLKNEEHKSDITATTDIHLNYADQDLNNETPPVAMECGPKNGDCLKSSTVGSSESRPLTLQQLAKLNATRLSSLNTSISNHSAHFGSYIETSILTENLKMLASESPVKLIEDEPNPIPLSESVPDLTALSDNTCSNTEFDARLKMLRIAMSRTQTPEAPIIEQTPTHTPIASIANCPPPSDVETILKDLRSLVREHVEIPIREQFNVLIDALSAAIHNSASKTEASSQTRNDSPNIYKRQATFDLDLELQKNKADLVTGSSQNIEELPDLMTCSSATYDAESVDKPTACPSPKESPDVAQKKTDSYLTAEVVNDNLAHQINELLERHNLTKMQLNDTVQHYASEHNETKSGGQTVILVVNSTATKAEQLPPSCKASGKENRDSTSRRRSLSLSIHDKTKQDRPKSVIKQSSVESNVTTTTSSLTVVPNTASNAMASFQKRRNSFCVGSIAGKTNATAAAAAAAQSRALLSGRSKTGALTESNIKCTPTTRANVPVKRVLPMVKASLLSAEGSHLNTTRPRFNVQDTPLSTRASSTAGGQMFCTSTPMPQMRMMARKSLKPVSSYSNTFSKKAAQ